MDRIKLGAAAEHIFIAKCLLAGLECFTPVSSCGRVDVIVGRQLARCQVKTITDRPKGRTHKTMPLRKVSCNSKSNTKVHVYTVKDCDFIVGVEMQTLEIFIVPMKYLNDAGYTRGITITTMRDAGFCENFEPLREWHRLKDSNPPRAVLETAALPHELSR